MAVTFSNIVVGAGVISVGDTLSTVTDLGATQDGAEIAWEPDMVDIEIDQFGDAALIVQNMVKVSLKTKLAEGTLENLRLVWNYPDSKLVTGSGTKTLNLGIQSVYLVEKALKLVGNAPSTTSSVTYTRTYSCNRVMSYSSSSHTVKRAENTAFPVDFRILPDNSQTGAEYGTIVDQTP